MLVSPAVWIHAYSQTRNNWLEKSPGWCCRPRGKDAWEEVAGREQAPEAVEHAEEEPEAEEYPGAKEDEETEEVHSTPPIIGSYLQATITNDINSLFSPETMNR